MTETAADRAAVAEATSSAGTLAKFGLICAVVPFFASYRTATSSSMTSTRDGAVVQHAVQAQVFDYVAVPLGVLAAALAVLALLGVARAGDATSAWKSRMAVMALGAAVLGIYQALHGVGMV